MSQKIHVLYKRVNIESKKPVIYNFRGIIICDVNENVIYFRALLIICVVARYDRHRTIYCNRDSRCPAIYTIRVYEKKGSIKLRTHAVGELSCSGSINICFRAFNVSLSARLDCGVWRPPNAHNDASMIIPSTMICAAF